jgi:hypothetical protein
VCAINSVVGGCTRTVRRRRRRQVRLIKAMKEGKKASVEQLGEAIDAAQEGVSVSSEAASSACCSLSLSLSACVPAILSVCSWCILRGLYRHCLAPRATSMHLLLQQHCTVVIAHWARATLVFVTWCWCWWWVPSFIQTQEAERPSLDKQLQELYPALAGL